jgi:hypothetical protein
VFDAVTGDAVALVDLATAQSPSFSFDTLNSGKVFVRTRSTSGEVCWHWSAGGRGDYGAGPAVSVTAGQQHTVQLKLGPGCVSATPALLTKPPAPRGWPR